MTPGYIVNKFAENFDIILTPHALNLHNIIYTYVWNMREQTMPTLILVFSVTVAAAGHVWLPVVRLHSTCIALHPFFLWNLSWYIGAVMLSLILSVACLHYK